MQLLSLRERLRAHGALPSHEARVLRLWSCGLPQSAGRRRPEDFLPATLRAALPAIEADLDRLARLRSAHAADDGAASRLLVELADGQAVEAVLLPRGGLCVSSQVGCAVGCTFCMTGRDGLVRQLGSAEIVAQVALARRLRAVRKVVFMGMGEPAHNLDAVLEAIDLLGTAGGVGHKDLVLSTVGDWRVLDALGTPRAVRPALAFSLHATDPALRARLLPRAPRLDLEAFVAAADAYARATGYPLQVQWTLLAGVNDGLDQVDGLVRLLGGRRAILNLIPYNRVAGFAWERPSFEATERLAQALHRRGVRTTVRRSAAQDVDGGCGQLRAREARPRAAPIAIRPAAG
jgi:23S rRNA (adenine2503-C2)-methyltransferase